jgi:hypothetical protein
MAMSMPDLFLIFNHEITPRQKEDARKSLKVERIIDLPPDLKGLWQSIPSQIPELKPCLQPIRRWLKTNAATADYVLVQGDFGACFIMARFALANDLIPVYSTTDRKAVEQHENDGSVTLVHRFKHDIFRRYGV